MSEERANPFISLYFVLPFSEVKHCYHSFHLLPETTALFKHLCFTLWGEISC